MPWIDKQEDYFLHDFSNSKNSDNSNNLDRSDLSDRSDKSDRSESSDKSDRTDRTDRSENARSFSFDERGGSEPQAPAPRKRHRGRKVLLWFIFIVLLVGGGAFWVRYLNPYTQDTLTTGYITNVEKRGIFFKTYEGEMVSENVALDSARVYQRDLHFSIPSPELARELQSLQGTGRKVTITTEKSYGVLPWRGASNVIVTNVEPAQTSLDR